MAPMDQPSSNNATGVNNTLYEIEITPILNAPYQLAQVTIPLQDLKVALTYRYMYERRAIRLVTRSESKEYIINFKNQRHKDKALKCILRLAGQHLDPLLQRLECANDSIYENEVA